MRYAPAGRGRGDLAVELPAGHPVRDDRGARWPPATRSCSSRPSSRPGCALMLVQALRAGGVPPVGDLAAARARATSGRRSSRIPRVQTIAFTGSLPVGLEINRAAAETSRPASTIIKRVVAELGGKNCVIVDSDADLDEAVPAIVSSAFVYAGQKCSAAARVLVHEAIADQLIERVAGRGPGAGGRSGRRARDRRPAGDRARRPGTGRPLRRAGRDAGPDRRPGRAGPRARAGSARRRWRPTCRADSPVLNEEIFGPLLAIDRVATSSDACDVVDGLPFALTGGLFARDPATVRYVRERSARSATCT